VGELKTNPREPLDKLKTYPAFQHLRAKAETHELQFRPKEALKLKNKGLLDEILDSRSESCWNALQDCLANGMHLNEAEELALPNILLVSKSEEEQERLDCEEQEQMEGE
jgi:hypothetical protein